jgi:hypothetical protein
MLITGWKDYSGLQCIAYKIQHTMQNTLEDQIREQIMSLTSTALKLKMSVIYLRVPRTVVLNWCAVDIFKGCHRFLDLTF